MTDEQKAKILENMHRTIRICKRLTAADFIEWGITRLADARELIGEFNEWEKEHHDFSWRISEEQREIKVKDPETGKKVKKTVIEWKAAVDWAYRRTR